LKEGKKEQQDFKTLLGSITGGVGTVGGVIAGVGNYVVNDPNAKQTMTGVTSFVTAGLGAVGSVVTALVSPGEAKVKASTDALKNIDDKKEAAHEVLKKDPSSWSDSDKEKWSKANKELLEACK
jgi:hypothetical protein